jgi:two-component system nitrogen regulation response regulator GlnG
MPTLLVVDDEPNVLYSIEKALQTETLQVVAARSGRQGIEAVQRNRPDAVILDVRLTDMSGLDAFNLIRQIDSRLPVIVITAYATTETAIEAMKRGAFEYLVKPVEFHQLREVVKKALEVSRLSHVPAVFDEASAAEEGVDRIVGRSPQMQEVYKDIGRVAPQDVPVLIVGSSGTGKELVARALYSHSRRSQGPFLTINCAAIPEALLESELFGHERGAFTGADRRRIGKFEQASGGTLFLDEIGDMVASTQSKVLRLLQEQRFERVGSNETIQTDVRVIAATNQDLGDLVTAGRFRQDLFYRLQVFTIRLPSLTERLSDLPILVEHMVKVFNRAMGKQVRTVAPEVLRLLEAHDWPGNVRELQSAIKYALIHATGEVLTADCLPEAIRVGTGQARPAALASQDNLDVGRFVGDLLRKGDLDIYDKVCLEVDRMVLSSVLRHARGNQVQASQLLGISRNTLRAKLRSLGLAVEKHVNPESEKGD